MLLAIRLIYLFAIIGLFDAIYMIYHKVKGTDVACPFFPPVWCRKVQYSKQSKTFGIPNSVAGFCIYLGILVFTFLMTHGLVTFWPVIALIYLGTVFSLYFLGVQAFVLRAFCTWCVLSAINFIVMFIAQFYL